MGEPIALIIECRWLIRLNRGLHGLRRLRGFFIGFRRCLLSEPGFMGLQADFHCCYPSIQGHLVLQNFRCSILTDPL